MEVLLNDVHSRLNETRVSAVVKPRDLNEIRYALDQARARGLKVSVGGARHAMGGQQFAHGGLHIDTRALCAVLGSDSERGLLHIQAGADWPCIMAASHAVARPLSPGKDAASHPGWAIRQKQTGVDTVSLGGSIAANAHGRGLRMQPLADDIEDLTLMDAKGQLQQCSRSQNAELFSLVLGGYGLFGVVVSATLRLTRRQKLKRWVDVLDLRDALTAAQRRAQMGAVYGDFQFVIDPQDPGFLQRGVLACYLPVADDTAVSDAGADLSGDAWLKLLKLAHDDKSSAFRLYAQHYLGTHGRVYWSDTMQLSTYIPSYADYLVGAQGPDSQALPPESLVIGEHYVPGKQLHSFMEQAAQALRNLGSEVIYGTIRSIRRDTTSFLPWATDNFACVIFNLRTPHTTQGRQRTADAFRSLINISSGLGGSFFLTYHRYASAAQVERCHPRIRQWLALKRQYDPEELFSSDWYRHYRDAFAPTQHGPL
jgi:FAD/FMN-containing dehydrogenase